MRAGVPSLLLLFSCALGCSANGADGSGFGSEGGTLSSAGGAGGSAGVAGDGGQASGGAAGSSGSAGAGDAGGGAGGMQGGDVGVITIEEVAPFRGAAAGAYTIMHDDLCDYTIDSLFDIAEPELNARGLHAAFGAIVERCVERDLWTKVHALVDEGHEIMNHSWTHLDIGQGASFSEQIDQAQTVLDENLPSPSSFFIFPYDSFTDDAVNHLGSIGYLGARAGTKGLNEPDFTDALRVKFDVYGGENSIYESQGDILKYYVDLAISERGWAVRELHGIADQTFFPVPVEDYKAHLDYVASKVESGELLVDTPTNIIHYRFARQYCGTPAVSGNSLAFPSPSAPCTDQGSLLTVVIGTEVDVTTLYATQGDKDCVTKKLGSKRYAVDVDPSAGSALISGD